MLLMAFVHSAEELVILRIFQGLMTGTMAAANALVASAAPRERSGYAMGLMQMGCGAGLATGPLIGGVIADRLGYSAAFYVTAGMIFVAGLMVMTGVREEFKPKESVDAGVIKFLAEWRRILSAPGVTIIYSMRFLSAMGRMMIVPIMPLFILTLLTKGAGVNTDCHNQYFDGSSVLFAAGMGQCWMATTYFAGFGGCGHGRHHAWIERFADELY
jgi:DHA1 family multidrug resistance protein-like MFS transporter